VPPSWRIGAALLFSRGPRFVIRLTTQPAAPTNL
jgi:hypothetical protein